MILGIETSAPRASLALCDPETGEIVWQKEFTTDRAHNAVIFSPLQEMLVDYRSELEGIVVGLGPGSYSGIRVGIAVANGLSLALDIPTRGVSSLEAWDVEADSYVVLGDARRGSFFVAEIEDSRLVGEPDLIDAGTVESRLSSFRERNLGFFTADKQVAEKLDNVELKFPSATCLPIDPPETWPEFSPLEPHYLRAPYITTPKKRGR